MLFIILFFRLFLNKLIQGKIIFIKSIIINKKGNINNKLYFENKFEQF